MENQLYQNHQAVAAVLRDVQLEQQQQQQVAMVNVRYIIIQDYVLHLYIFIQQLYDNHSIRIKQMVE